MAGSAGPAACHDEAAVFVSLLTRGARNHLVPEDMVPLIQDVVDTHPGLLFLKEATEFHSRYVHTVSRRGSAMKMNMMQLKGCMRLVSFSEVK